MRWPSNKFLFAVHRWVGLNCGVILFVICLSGTVATLSEEIDWLITPALRVAPGREPLSWGELARRVEEQHPDAAVRAIRAPRDRNTAAFVDVESDWGQRATLYVDPYTGNVQGAASFHCVKVLFRVFHKQFYIFGFPKGIHGTYIVGMYGFALLLAGLTGLLFYKRFWRRMFALRWRSGWDIFWRDVHRLLGVWTAALLFVWAITGIWYLAERGLSQAGLLSNSIHFPLGREQQDRPRGNAIAGDSVHELQVDEYLAAAAREFPHMQVKHLILPRTAGGPTVVSGTSVATLVDDNADQVLIDSVSGEVLATRDARELNAVDRWTVTVNPVHFGTFGGLPTKIVWCLGGLGVSLLIPIGATIWYRRTSRQRPANSADDHLPARSRRAKIASIALTSTVLAVAASYTWMMMPLREAPPSEPKLVADLDPIVVGPWTAQLSREGAVEPGGRVTFRLRFPGRSRPNLKGATIRVGESAETFRGTWEFYRARVALNDSDTIQSELQLALESATGETFRHDFSPSEWAVAGERIESSLPAPEVPAMVSILFVSFFAIVGLLTSVWFWKIG